MKVEKPFFNLGANIRTSYLRPDLFPVREARHVHNIFSPVPLLWTLNPTVTLSGL